MAWYEILTLLIVVIGLCVCLYFVCYYDYKYKLKRLDFENQKATKLDNQLNMIIDILKKKEGD